MIGVLKAIGAGNTMIRKIFLYQSARLILKGLIIGNAIGIGLSLIQKKFEVLSLDPENYYLTRVPVNIDLMNIILINAGAALAILSFLILPSMLVSRISPSRVISFK
jgi:lipoprotein-releasing system permease protein